MTVPQASAKPGLFAERTQLAWERTAIGFLAVGAIVLLPHRGPLTADRAVVAVASVLVSLIVFRIGRRRSKRVDQVPFTAVRLVGLATAVLAVVLAVLILRLGSAEA